MIDKFIKYLLCAFFLLVPLSSWKVKFHGIPVSADFVLAALIIFLYILKLVLFKDRRKTFERLKLNLLGDKFWVFTAVYVFACLLSFMKAVNLAAGINELMRFLSYIFLYYIIVSENDGERYIYSLLKFFLVSCFLVTLFGIIQEFTAFGLDPSFNVEQYFGVSRRIASTMFNPNNLAAFSIMAAYPALLTALYTKNKRLRYALLSLFVLLAVNLLLTFSREGWLGFFVGAVVLAIVYYRKIFIFICLLPFTLFVGSIRERVFSTFDMSLNTNYTRLRLWKTGLMMIKENPIFGVGLGNSIYRYDEYVARYPDLNAGFTMYPLHNSYIKTEAETGILGIISFLSMLIYILVRTFKISRIAQNPVLKGLSGGFFVSATGYLVMNLFDNCFFDPQTAVFFWLLFALVVSLSKASAPAGPAEEISPLS